MRAGSKVKYLRFITGRHDLPFYYDKEVEVQRSFLDAFLKGEDRDGWSTPGKKSPIDICLRLGNPGVNNPPAELAAFPRRQESEWPIASTVYTKFYLSAAKKLTRDAELETAVFSYKAPIGEVSFETEKFEEETEITGHPLAHLSVSLQADGHSTPSDMDLFLTIRHFDKDNQESMCSAPHNARYS